MANRFSLFFFRYVSSKPEGNVLALGQSFVDFGEVSFTAPSRPFPSRCSDDRQRGIAPIRPPVPFLHSGRGGHRRYKGRNQFVANPSSPFPPSPAPFSLYIPRISRRGAKRPSSFPSYAKKKCWCCSFPLFSRPKERRQIVSFPENLANLEKGFPPFLLRNFLYIFFGGSHAIEAPQGKRGTLAANEWRSKLGPPFLVIPLFPDSNKAASGVGQR